MRIWVWLWLFLMIGAFPVSVASRDTFGSEQTVKSRTFELVYQTTIRNIPVDADTLEAWVPMPQTDSNQTIHQISIDAPVPVTLGREPRYGNLVEQVIFPATTAGLSFTLTDGAGFPSIVARHQRALRDEIIFSDIMTRTDWNSAGVGI